MSGRFQRSRQWLTRWVRESRNCYNDRMKRAAFHCAWMGVIIAAIVFCTFYPFLPGRYDGLAFTLSGMAQVFGVAGLPLVPIGALWLAYELRKRARRKRNLPQKERGYHLAVVSLIVLSLVVATACLVAAQSTGFSLALILLASWTCAVTRLLPKLKHLKSTEARDFHPAPLYLLLIPLAVLSLQNALAAPATELSRNRAITNSAELLREIGHYHETYGHYPQNLSSPTQDYKPAVIGIPQYHYAPSGEAYNLYFEMPTFLFSNPGTREIVMYNKLGQHAMPSHDSDILRWTPEQLAARRGWYALQDTSTPYWKYFWFD